MPSNLKSKSELRSDLLQQLNQIPASTRLAWSHAIQSRLQNLLTDESGYWAAYQSLADEPQIEWSAVSSNIQWCFPETQPANQLKFKHAPKTFQRSALGVAEPVDGGTITLDQLRGVIVPGLGFSERGHRLGRGKGYYDLALQSFTGKKIAICFGLSRLKQIPIEAHDILFESIVTENSVYHVDFPEGDLKWS